MLRVLAVFPKISVGEKLVFLDTLSLYLNAIHDSLPLLYKANAVILL